MVILEGYSVVGICIVVLGHSNRMFGCLGNLVMCSCHDGGGPSGTTRDSSSLSRGLIASSTKKICVVIINIMNYRNCELYMDCDISM